MTITELAFKRWMRENKLYTSKMAAELGTSYHTVRRWIRGGNVSRAYRSMIQQKWPDCILLDQHR